MPGRPALTAISSLASVSFSGSVFRVVLDSLREKVLSTEGNRYYSGRYHVVGETGVLYTSLSEEIATRELGRHARRADLRGELATGVIKVRLRRVLDSTPSATGAGTNLVVFEHQLAEGCAIEVARIGRHTSESD